MPVYGANTPFGSRTMVCRLNSVSSSSLIRAAHAVAEQRAVGHDHRGPARASASLPQLPHDELQEQQRRLGGLLVVREVVLDALLLLAAERRVGQDHVHAVLVADLGELDVAGCSPSSICGASRPCSSRFIWQSRYGSGFASCPKMLPLLQRVAVARPSSLLLQVLERLDQEAAGAAGRVEHGFARAADRCLRP